MNSELRACTFLFMVISSLAVGRFNNRTTTDELNGAIAKNRAVGRSLLDKSLIPDVQEAAVPAPLLGPESFWPEAVIAAIATLLCALVAARVVRSKQPDASVMLREKIGPSVVAFIVAIEVGFMVGSSPRGAGAVAGTAMGLLFVVALARRHLKVAAPARA